MLWFFLLFSTGCWGIAEIFYKKGNTAEEKYAHLKTTVFVGIFFGIYSLVILLTQGIDFKAFPSNMIRYFPVAICYLVSMMCSYYGVRYIEESISDPIENTSCAFVPILCALIMHEELSTWMIVAIICVVIGILGAGLFDKEGKEHRTKLYGKKMAVVAIAMPFCYMALDAVGTFLDVFYTDSVETTALINVTEENLEHTANCCYEIIFFVAAMGILLYMHKHHVHLFETYEGEAKEKPLSYRIGEQKNKILAALFETGGQATYLFALSEGSGIAAVILGAGTVIISFILSRIWLKEKLTLVQYSFIALIFVGIIILSLVG